MNILFLAGILIFSGCSGKLGYSVLLWNNPEHGISDGTILKVYIKSNISQVYVVSLVDSKEKFELPLWQITDPESKSKNLKKAERFAEFSNTYASVKLDGLPIRAEPVNTAKQIYRLRKGEVIRCLYRGKGAAVTNGNGNMSGEWLRVLTSGGTQGWCFSHNLDLFKAENEIDGSASIAAESQQTAAIDAYIKMAASKKWYPDYYKAMIRSKKIDLERMNEDYGFVIELAGENEASGTLNINHPLISKSWKFDEITKLNGRFVFGDSKVELIPHGEAGLSVQYMGSDGKTRVLDFISVEENIETLISDELYRRQEILKTIAQAGPVFKSSNYGTIEFNNENSVTWKNYQLLVPSIISKNALGSVSISIDFFMADSLKASYDGVLTMHFVGMEDSINFLYKLTENGLRLEDASKATVRDGEIVARSASPLVMFFEKK